MKFYIHLLILIFCVGCDSSRKITSTSNTEKEIKLSEIKNENHTTLSDLNYNSITKNNLNIKIIEYFPSDSSGYQDVKRIIEIIDQTEKNDNTIKKDSVSILKNDTIIIEERISENIEIKEEKKFESGKYVVKWLAILILILILIIILLIVYIKQTRI